MNQENMDLFWKFVYERQAVWHRRFILKEPAPWTRDPILREFKFTNVYRELDKGTVYYLRNVVSDPDSTPEAYIFRTLVYRVFNHIPTWEDLDAAGICWPESWKVDRAISVLRNIAETKGRRVFTNAHIVSPYNSTPGDTKYEKVAHIAGAWADHIGVITASILACPTLERVFKYLCTLYGLGPFLAYEVCIDLMYHNVIKFSEEDWANAGPGAMRGANLIFPARRDYLNIMRELRDTQETHFERLGLLWSDVSYDKRPWLSLRGIEHSLCEFQKYERAYRQRGRPRNTFQPTSQNDEHWMEELRGGH